MLLKRLIFAVLCVGLLGPLSCKTAVPEGELVAKVNGKGISKAAFDGMVERNMARYQGHGHTLPPGIESRIKESVLRRMIDDKVIALKAEESGISVTDAELDTKFQEHKDRFRTEQAFTDYLKRSNNTADAMKQDLRRNMLRDQVVEKLSGAIDVTDEDVGKYYEENKQRFIEKEQIKAARILLKPDVAPGASDADLQAADGRAQSLAREVYTKATSNGTDFGGLAAQYSMGPEKNRRGELGWLTRGRMPPPFDNVAFSLEPNGVSEPVKIKNAWEIIKVTEKRPERQRTLDQVKENIRNSLLARRRNEKRRDVLRNLKKDAQVEHLIKLERPTPTRPGQPPMGGQGPRSNADFKAPRNPRPMMPGQPNPAGRGPMAPGAMQKRQLMAPGAPPPGAPPPGAPAPAPGAPAPTPTPAPAQPPVE